MSFIAPDDHWALWSVILGIAALGLWAEKTTWGRVLSGAVVAILGGLLLSNLGVIPHKAPAYDVVWTYVLPLSDPDAAATSGSWDAYSGKQGAC